MHRITDKRAARRRRDRQRHGGKWVPEARGSLAHARIAVTTRTQEWHYQQRQSTMQGANVWGQEAPEASVATTCHRDALAKVVG